MAALNHRSEADGENDEADLAGEKTQCAVEKDGTPPSRGAVKVGEKAVELFDVPCAIEWTDYDAHGVIDGLLLCLFVVLCQP